MEVVRTNAGKVEKGSGRRTPGGREKKEREEWEETAGRLFWAPRANELKQETGKGLPLNLSTVSVVVVVFTQKVRAAVWLPGCFPVTAPFSSYRVV